MKLSLLSYKLSIFCKSAAWLTINISAVAYFPLIGEELHGKKKKSPVKARSDEMTVCVLHEQPTPMGMKGKQTFLTDHL